MPFFSAKSHLFGKQKSKFGGSVTATAKDFNSTLSMINNPVAHLPRATGPTKQFNIGSSFKAPTDHITIGAGMHSALKGLESVNFGRKKPKNVKLTV